jgi:hypothetical protein
MDLWISLLSIGPLPSTIASPDARTALLDALPRACRTDRREEGLRPRPVRRLHRPMPKACASVRWSRYDDLADLLAAAMKLARPQRGSPRGG